ncbi:MAG TPA: glycine/sarcosine/betaine reductase complex component C subunit beta [Chloroflexota bacterium]
MAAVKAVAYALAHVPDLVRHGSKPRRQLHEQPELEPQLRTRLRSWEEAAAYPPNQAFIGNLRPEALPGIPRPWFKAAAGEASPAGKLGVMIDQAKFYEQLRLADQFGVINDAGQGLPLFDGPDAVAHLKSGHDQDEALQPEVLLENLACKASAAVAVGELLRASAVAAADIDYLINTGEEAVGDRYQRGAGNMAKAVAEMAGCLEATGEDVKAFCCAPVHGCVTAAALVDAGVFRNAIVFGGGSLAKLGMKFEAHLKHDMPVLEDVLAAMAVLIAPDDGINPHIRLDVVGRHPVKAGSSAQAITECLVVEPLRRAGIGLKDVDRYATELHNPEITEPAGGGDVARTNYRTLAAVGVMDGQLTKQDIDAFVTRHGVPGFSPTQGHIPAGLPYLGHAREAMLAGEINRAMFVAKGSLFLGMMTRLSDGMSFLLQRSTQVG